MKTIKDKDFVRLIPKESIESRIVELAQDINQHYYDKNPLFLAILNGSFMFVAELFKSLNIPCEISFIKVKSYEKLTTTGNTQELIGLHESLKERHVVVVEDIVDTGQTLSTVMPLIAAQNPASMKILTLLHKPAAALVPIEPDYVGFSIEPQFVIGFGLDYDGYGRNIPEIMVLKN